MLVLCLCVFLHYDLLHGGQEKENHQDGFLDYSITEMWWNGTPGIEQTDRLTVQYSFMPTPPGHGQFPGPDDGQTDPPMYPEVLSEELKTFTPFPNITRPSYPFSVENHTVVAASRAPRPPPLPSPWHINFPGLTPPPNFPSDYKYPTVFPTTVDSYSPSPTGPTPKGPSFTLPFVSRPEFTYPTLFPTSTPLFVEHGLPRVPGPDTTTTPPAPEVPYVSWHPADAYMKLWKKQIAADVAASTTPLDTVPKIQQIFDYDFTISAEQFPVALRRIPNIRQRKFRSIQPVEPDAGTAQAPSSIGSSESEAKLPANDSDSRAVKKAKQKSITYTQTLSTASMLTQDMNPLGASAANTRGDSHTHAGDDHNINKTRLRRINQ